MELVWVAEVGTVRIGKVAVIDGARLGRCVAVDARWRAGWPVIGVLSLGSEEPSRALTMRL